METSSSIKELSAALSKAQGEITNPRKGSANPFFKSLYADLASCVDAIRAAFAQNGLAYTQHIRQSDSEEVCVETIILHASGEWMSCGILALPVNKADAQGYGSALTYARRYSLGAAVGLAPEDDDGNTATKPKAKPEPKQEGPKLYPDADFMKNFPAWKKLIESGKKTSADLIAMIETKGALSDAQKDKISNINPDIEAAMRTAQNVEVLALIAAERIATVADPDERKRLMAIHDELEATMVPA